MTRLLKWIIKIYNTNSYVFSGAESEFEVKITPYFINFGDNLKKRYFRLYEKWTILIFFRKMFFSIRRNCLAEAKLGEYVVHIIDNSPQKKKIWKVAFLKKSIFKIFRKTAAIFSIFKILIFFSDSIELKIPHHMKGKPTECVYLVKNCIILEKILAFFMKFQV